MIIDIPMHIYVHNYMHTYLYLMGFFELCSSGFATRLYFYFSPDENYIHIYMYTLNLVIYILAE